jgi:hypothetical protein
MITLEKINEFIETKKRGCINISEFFSKSIEESIKLSLLINSVRIGNKVSEFDLEFNDLSKQKIYRSLLKKDKLAALVYRRDLRLEKLL